MLPPKKSIAKRMIFFSYNIANEDQFTVWKLRHRVGGQRDTFLEQAQLRVLVNGRSNKGLELDEFMPQG
jgi:hypothetical protein